MRVLVLQHAAAERFRTVQYYFELGVRGIECVEAPRNDRAALARELKKADVLWIARVLPSPLELAWMQGLNPNILFDFDDALHLRSSRHGARPGFSKTLRFKLVLEAARRVAAGNSFLADEAGRITDSHKVVVVPTVVNRSWYPPKVAAGHGAFTVGWIGSRSTLRYLESLHEALEAFHALGRPWRLVVVSDAFPVWPNLPVENRPWALAREAADLASFDVGLNPLDDDDWCRGKCALKIVQTMAAGACALGSPVGMNLELIESGVTGHLPGTSEEWVVALASLEANRLRTAAMGAKARERIWSRFTMEAQVDAVEKLLRETAS